MSYQDYVLQNQDKFKAPLITPQTGKLRAVELGTKNNKSNAYNPIPIGKKIPDILSNRTSGAVDAYLKGRTKQSAEVASDVISKTPMIKMNEFGQPEKEPSEFSNQLNKQLTSTREYGQMATQSEEAKAQYQSMQRMQDMSSGIIANISPGASGDNPGAKAVAMAMDAFNRGTPYVWGGNSLTGGVDCSGLVQQVYGKLGIKVPRTTYEQAKSGRRVSLAEALPGDLVFFNTGSSDPNGIGTYGHVGIYTGNGQMVDARNSKSGIKVGSINIHGGPALVIRPW